MSPFSPPTGSTSTAYSIITGVTPPVPVPASFASKYALSNTTLPGFKLVDFRNAVPRVRVGANFATFTGFNALADTSDWSRIDFIFGGSNRGWTADAYKVDMTVNDDGIIESDHRLVFADVVL
jgi:hypothetical protein